MMQDWKLLKANEKFSFIKKYVQINVQEGLKFKGLVFTVDPVSESIVLQSGEKVSIINGKKIESISLIAKSIDEEPTVDLHDLITPKPHSLSESELEVNKEKLLSWLKRNKLNVSLEGKNIKVEDYVTILPPYTAESCMASNEIILQRIQSIIGNMKE